MGVIKQKAFFAALAVACSGITGLGCQSKKPSPSSSPLPIPAEYRLTLLAAVIIDDDSVVLNNNGDILIANDSPDSEIEVWRGGRRQTLRNTCKDNVHRFTHASGMNNQGTVVGSITGEGNGAYLMKFSSAVIWRRDRMTELLPASPSETVADGINDAGDVVGHTFEISSDMTADTDQAFLYHHGGMTDLGSGQALRVNNRGQIVVRRPDLNNQDDSLYFWQGGFERLIDVPQGYQGFDTINGLNDQGQVIGQVGTTRPSQSCTDRAFLWQNGKMRMLGTFGGQFSRAFGINNKGQVVGQSDSTGNAEPNAFLWQNGRMYDLNHFIPGHSGWILFSADGINDRGQIVGRGSKGTFLLTPR